MFFFPHLFQGQTPLFPRIFGHEAGGYVSLLNILKVESHMNGLDKDWILIKCINY
jgi:hypothetical protein